MVKKIFVLGAMVIMAFTLSLGLVGCGDKTADDQVLLAIKVEFRDKFEQEKFMVEDFAWDNIDKIVYGGWTNVTDTGRLVVYLKKHGKNRVKQAVKHFKTLEFVKNAEPAVYDVHPC